MHFRHEVFRLGMAGQSIHAKLRICISFPHARYDRVNCILVYLFVMWRLSCTVQVTKMALTTNGNDEEQEEGKCLLFLRDINPARPSRFMNYVWGLGASSTPADQESLSNIEFPKHRNRATPDIGNGMCLCRIRIYRKSEQSLSTPRHRLIL